MSISSPLRSRVDPAQVRAIVLDCDGVVLESAQVKTAAFRELFADEPQSAAIVAYHLAHTGVPRLTKFQYIHDQILQRPLTPAVSRALSERFSSLVRGAILECPEVPGLRELLRRSADRLRCYVASATPHDELREVLAARGLLDSFADVVGHPTAKADVIVRVREQHGWRPEQVVMVGDSRHDYEAARRAGAPFVARRCEDRTLQSSSGIPTVDDLYGLVDWLQPALTAATSEVP